MRGAHFRILAGAQSVAGVGKQSGQLDGAGAGIHLAIGEGEAAFVRIDAAVGKDQLERAAC